MYTEFTPRPEDLLSFTNLDTGEGQRVQFNPTEFEEQLAVNYARLAPPGLSHQRMQYVNTGNQQVNFDVFFRAGSTRAPAPIDTNRQPIGSSLSIASVENGQDFKRFIYSLCYANEATEVSGGSPPDVLVVWPGVLSLVTRITRVRVRNQMFNRRAGVVEFTMTLTIEEIRDFRLLSDDVRASGLIRDTAALPEGA